MSFVQKWWANCWCWWGQNDAKQVGAAANGSGFGEQPHRSKQSTTSFVKQTLKTFV